MKIDRKIVNRWLERTQQKIKRFIDNPHFIDAVSQVRIQYKIPDTGFSNDQEYQDWHNNQVKTSLYRIHDRKIVDHECSKDHNFFYKKYQNFRIDFERSLFRLMDKYKISSRFTEYIKEYSLFNKWDDKKTQVNDLHIEAGANENTGLGEIIITISDDATLNDLRAMWPWIRERQKELSSFRQDRYYPIAHLASYKRAYELRFSEHKKYREIAKILEDENLGSYTYDEISTLIKRYKKFLGQD